MALETLSPSWGPAFAIAGSLVIVGISVFEECLRDYRRSDFFEGMDESHVEYDDRYVWD